MHITRLGSGTQRLWQSLQRLRAITPGGGPRGRILAVKWGMNPNSSSLGVDVTFLLFGAAALSMATPVIAALVRFGWRAPASPVETDVSPASPTASPTTR